MIPSHWFPNNITQTSSRLRRGWFQTESARRGRDLNRECDLLFLVRSRPRDAAARINYSLPNHQMAGNRLFDSDRNQNVVFEEPSGGGLRDNGSLRYSQTVVEITFAGFSDSVGKQEGNSFLQRAAAAVRFSERASRRAVSAIRSCFDRGGVS